MSYCEHQPLAYKCKCSNCTSPFEENYTQILCHFRGFCMKQNHFSNPKGNNCYKTRKETYYFRIKLGKCNYYIYIYMLAVGVHNTEMSMKWTRFHVLKGSKSHKNTVNNMCQIIIENIN
jgi:hypothetical protein